jgi:hypothetical protein
MSNRQDRSAARQILKAVILRKAEAARVQAMEIENVTMRQQLADSEARNAVLSALVPIAPIAQVVPVPPIAQVVPLPPIAPVALFPVGIPVIDLSVYSDEGSITMPILVSSDPEDVTGVSEASTVLTGCYADVDIIAKQKHIFCDYLGINGRKCRGYAGYMVRCYNCLAGKPPDVFDGPGCTVFCKDHILFPDVVCSTCDLDLEYISSCRLWIQNLLKM